MSAIRLARAATGREQLLKFAGAYHGHVDGLLAEAGSGLATAGASRPARACRSAPGRGDRRSSRGTTARPSSAAIDEHELAAILAEPIPANMGLVPPRRGLPRAPARAAPTDTGALLVFDEVITGFRVARGGAQELLGVVARPDRDGQGHRRRPARRRLRRLARADGADRARPATSTRPGTLVGQPARRRRRRSRRCEQLDDAGLPAPRRARPTRARRRPARGRRRRRARCRSRARTGLLTVFFTDEPVRDYAGAPACDTERLRALLPGAARRAASTRRRRSSRPGSRRSPTPPSTSSARSRRPPPRSRRSRDGRGARARRRGAARRGRPARRGAAAPAARRPGRRPGARRARRRRPARRRPTRPPTPPSSRPSARATCCTTARSRLLDAGRPRPRAARRRPPLRARPRAARRARRPRRRPRARRPDRAARARRRGRRRRPGRGGLARRRRGDRLRRIAALEAAKAAARSGDPARRTRSALPRASSAATWRPRAERARVGQRHRRLRQLRFPPGGGIDAATEAGAPVRGRTQAPEEPVHHRPRDARRLRGRDDHPPRGS